MKYSYLETRSHHVTMYFIKAVRPDQGTLTEGEGSVSLTSLY
jgi:hypothetical protein